MFALSIVLLFVWAIGALLTLWGTWLCHRRLNSNGTTQRGLPPITILKPVKGVDSDLSQNLLGFFQLDYPKYELLICIASPDDPARTVIEKLIKEHPNVDAAMLMGEEPIGINPKINTISRAYRTGKYDHVLISDSNVRVAPNYLKDVSQSLDEKTGIATAVVAGTEPREMGGALEATYLNTFYARWMNLAAWMGFPAVVGKCMFFRRSVLDRVGGIKTFGRYIAEDYMAGQAMGLLGLKVCVMRIPVRQHIGEYSVRSYWQRHIRWGRIRKAQAPLAFSVEPLFFSVVSGVFAAFSLQVLLGVSPWLVFIAHLTVWACLDLFLIHQLDRVRWKICVAWLFREILAVPLWAHAMVGNSVSWRGNRYKISFGGIVSQAE